MGEKKTLTKQQAARLEEAEAMIKQVFLEQLQKRFPLGMRVYVRNAHRVLADPEDAVRLNSFRVVGYRPSTNVFRNLAGTIHEDAIGDVKLRRLDKTGRRVYGEIVHVPPGYFWAYYKKVPKEK
jgi:hypothetical protein